MKLQRDQSIEIIHKGEIDWWYGRTSDGQVGWIPKDVVEAPESQVRPCNHYSCVYTCVYQNIVVSCARQELEITLQTPYSCVTFIWQWWANIPHHRVKYIFTIHWDKIWQVPL